MLSNSIFVSVAVPHGRFFMPALSLTVVFLTKILHLKHMKVELFTFQDITDFFFFLIYALCIPIYNDKKIKSK